MRSGSPYSFCTTTARVVLIIALALLCLLFSLVSCLNPDQDRTLPPAPSRGLLFEEKTRLGSTPPSCHNKCNGCHPCMAVQVPTLPSHSQVQPGSETNGNKLLNSYPAGNNNRYSNYKPLGWKCSCGDHFYNP